MFTNVLPGDRAGDGGPMPMPDDPNYQLVPHNAQMVYNPDTGEISYVNPNVGTAGGAPMGNGQPTSTTPTTQPTATAGQQTGQQAGRQGTDWMKMLKQFGSGGSGGQGQGQSQPSFVGGNYNQSGADLAAALTAALQQQGPTEDKGQETFTNFMNQADEQAKENERKAVNAMLMNNLLKSY